MHRREFVKILAATSALLLMPIKAFAAIWNTPAFEATKLNEALNGLGVHHVIASDKINIVAPDKAENGAVVQIEVRSEIANTESLAILVENNPTPLIASFVFSEGANPFVVTRIKMAETSDVQAVVKVGNQYFSAKKRVEVLENGCG
jgi:sulfur-oxidizing protein SoxY